MVPGHAETSSPPFEGADKGVLQRRVGTVAFWPSCDLGPDALRRARLRSGALGFAHVQPSVPSGRTVTCARQRLAVSLPLRSDLLGSRPRQGREECQSPVRVRPGRFEGSSWRSLIVGSLEMLVKEIPPEAAGWPWLRRSPFLYYKQFRGAELDSPPTSFGVTGLLFAVTRRMPWPVLNSSSLMSWGCQVLRV